MTLRVPTLVLALLLLAPSALSVGSDSDDLDVADDPDYYGVDDDWANDEDAWQADWQPGDGEQPEDVEQREGYDERVDGGPSTARGGRRPDVEIDEQEFRDAFNGGMTLGGSTGGGAAKRCCCCGGGGGGAGPSSRGAARTAAITDGLIRSLCFNCTATAISAGARPAPAAYRTIFETSSSGSSLLRWRKTMSRPNGSSPPGVDDVLITCTRARVLSGDEGAAGRRGALRVGAGAAHRCFCGVGRGRRRAGGGRGRPAGRRGDGDSGAAFRALKA